MFQLITIAHDTLSDPVARAEYDDHGDGDHSVQPDAGARTHRGPTAAPGEGATVRTRPRATHREPRLAPLLSSAREVVTPPVGRWKAEVAAAAVCGAGLILVWALRLANSPQIGFTPVLAVAAVAAVAASLWAPFVWDPRVQVGLMVGGVAGIAFGGYRAYGSGMLVLTFCAGAVLSWLCVCAVLERARWRSARELDSLVSRATAQSLVFGQVGAGDDPRLSSVIHDHAVLVHRLVTLPGVRVFHAVRSPGGARPVAHVVMRGARVAFIDSVSGPGGRYSLSPFGDSLLVDGRHLPGGEVAGPAAAQAWPYAVDGSTPFARPRHPQVRAFVMTAIPSSAVVSDDGPVMVSSPVEVVNECARWLTEGEPAVVSVDRRALYDLFRNIVR